MCGQKVVGRMTERTQRGDKGYNTGYLYRHQRSHLQLIKAHTYMVKVASLISLSVTKIHYQFVRRGRTGLSFTLRIILNPCTTPKMAAVYTVYSEPAMHCIVSSCIYYFQMLLLVLVCRISRTIMWLNFYCIHVITYMYVC